MDILFYLLLWVLCGFIRALPSCAVSFSTLMSSLESSRNTLTKPHHLHLIGLKRLNSPLPQGRLITHLGSGSASLWNSPFDIDYTGLIRLSFLIFNSNPLLPFHKADRQLSIQKSQTSLSTELQKHFFWGETSIWVRAVFTPLFTLLPFWESLKLLELLHSLQMSSISAKFAFTHLKHAGVGVQHVWWIFYFST